MIDLESSKHLYQPPLYRTGDGLWQSNYQKVLDKTPNEVNLDLSAIHSYLSFGFVSGNRTLLQNIKKQPWLSKISDDNLPVLESIPNHNFYTGTSDLLADKLFYLLVDEARNATKSFGSIYVLLTGGLDSRIVAGVLKFLYDNGELKSKPIAVTWGMEDSRDVVYAQNIARYLNFEWQHVPMTAEVVLDNIQAAAKELGLIHSPEMLHNMLFFKNLPKDSLVLAGSFGDSIGRAEFGGLHLLQLKSQRPNDNFSLLKNNVAAYATQGVQEDIQELKDRAPDSLGYMQNEHFMQGYRMRNGLCHALSIVNGNAKIYQMFTEPEVYKFIWSIHPSRRDDDIYAELLEKYFPILARMPWARTNKALNGKTLGAIKDLRPNYHEYTRWSKNELRQDLEKLIDLDWFQSVGIFNINNIESLRQTVRKSEERVGRVNDIWLWLAGFRVYVDHIEKKGKNLNIEKIEIEPVQNFKPKLISSLKDEVLNKNEFLNKSAKNLRKSYRRYEVKKLKKEFIKLFPPKQFQS
jgi:hypothetical protein